jgi:carbon storage regulator CsrA
MLVLSRRLNEKILFPGIDASVQVIAIKPGLVRLGIAAPPEVTVLRDEVKSRRLQASAPGTHGAVGPFSSPEISRMLQNRLHITSVGLEHLRRQLQAGEAADAEATLASLEEDLHLLRQRLRYEIAKGPLPMATPPGRTRKALLVEDNANERELLARFLRLAGLEVDTVGDGSDGLDYLRQGGRPYVVLLDMGLPRCDGATMVRQIRREPEWQMLKIFAVSGHTPEEFNLGSGPSGVDRWFLKPVDPTVLLRDLSSELEAAVPC